MLGVQRMLKMPSITVGLTAGRLIKFKVIDLKQDFTISVKLLSSLHPYMQQIMAQGTKMLDINKT